MDVASIAGLLLALGGILGGMLLEGGSLRQIVQPTAMLIVVGGTAGAVMVQFPREVLMEALRQGVRVLRWSAPQTEAVVMQLVEFAGKARRSSILALDDELELVRDPFLRRILMQAIDGMAAAELRAAMEMELDTMAELEEKVPQVFEAVGGYAPTVGIIGAVMGLIQVMQHLDHLDEVGRGIAVAFVATIYGVALANLVALPAAGKLKLRIEEEHRHRLMMIEGVAGILEGLTPRMVETRLRTFMRAAKSEAVDVPAGVPA